MMEFLRRNPWALPCLDAVPGLLNPHSVLRKKLLLVVALLETAPEHADFFDPQPHSRISVLLRLFVWGCSSGLKGLVGLVLYPISRRIS